MPTGYKQQTDIQDAKTFRIGSVKLEIGPYGGGYTDVGALVDASAVESWDDITVESDNAGIIEEGVMKHIVTISAVWQEINVANLAIAFAGLATGDTVAAAPVSETDETHVLTLYAQTELDYKNGDATEVDSLVVGDDATPTTTWVRDCDYVVGTTPGGYTTIARAYPTSIDTASAIVAVQNTSEYFRSAGAWDALLAVGDHIYVSGFTETANNGIKTVTACTTTLITVSETLVNEIEGDTVTITRGALVTGATVYCDYDYTPLVSRTYTTGGYTSKTARILRLTNTNALDLTWTMLVYKAYIGDGLNMAFPADDDRNPVPCPITFIGKIDTTRTIGDQLFAITDEQDTD